MKKFINLFFILSLITSIGFSQGQFRGNLAEGAENTIVFTARPMDNVNNIGFSTIEYFVRYPKTSPEFTYGTPVNNLTNFPGMTNWQVFKKSAQDATYWYDWFLYTAPSPITGLRNYTAGTPYEVIAVTVNGASVKDLGLTLVSQEQENPYYYVFTNNVGSDSRPALLSDYFYPATSVTGVAPNRVYAQDIILPVNFLSFYAVKDGDNAQLSWQVDGDKDNKYFEVTRSTNGRNFQTIQRIDALNNGLLVNSYEAVDININKSNSKEVYYQIQQFDKDGQSTKSPVRMLSVDGLGKSVTAFPNPAKTTTKVVVDAPEAGKGTLIMRDATGRQVRVMNAQFFRGINQIDMNVMNLASGDYNIQVSGGGVNETIKITKIN
jgi:hypothetical protein